MMCYGSSIVSQGEGKITVGEASKHKAELILELKENGEVAKSWIVTVDPIAEKVVNVEPYFNFRPSAYSTYSFIIES